METISKQLILNDSSFVDGKMNRPSLRKGCCNMFCKKVWILTTIDRMFWPLVIYPIYLTFGPWSIGHIIEDYMGVIFAWGILVNNTFLPGSFTYVYGFLQVLSSLQFNKAILR